MPDLSNPMTLVWIALAVLVLAVVIAAVAASSRKRRTAALRERFGPEYERVQQRHGARADSLLAARVRRVEKMRFRDLSGVDRARFATAWNTLQAQFVDDPASAVTGANALVKEVMGARGYSADVGFEQRAEDLSVDHPDMAEHYRAARTLAQAGTQYAMNTEDLRQAIVHYRAVFADLLRADAAEAQAGALRPATA